MRCAERTRQLGIKDALKLDSLGGFLTKIRDIAGRLRAPRTDAVLKHHNKSMIVDVAIRWGSTFAMLKRLLELRSTIEHEDLGDREINLSTHDWRKIQELVDVLAIPQNTTLQLQRENLTPGECFLALYKAIFELRKKNVATAHTIAENLEKRMQSITQNKVFLAAVWVDSRFRILLNSDQKEKAKLELFSV